MDEADSTLLADDDVYADYSNGREDSDHAVPANAIEIPDDGRVGFSWRKLWAFSGPSLLVSLAYLDPGTAVPTSTGQAPGVLARVAPIYYCRSRFNGQPP